MIRYNKIKMVRQKNSTKKTFDAKIYTSGTSLVVTIPNIIAKRMVLRNGEYLEVTIKKEWEE